jgi:PST family polysaccharide transporter
MWLAPIMILSALSSVPSVRIQRSGASWIFATGDIASSLTGAAAALGCALSGLGVWSLVVQQLVIWTVKLGVLFPLAGNRIAARPCPDALRYLLRHGTPLVGANLLNLFAISVDALLIGRFLGITQLGFYVLAFQIVRIPEAILNGPVFLAFLPAIVRLDMDRAAAAHLFLKAIRVMLTISAPLMLGLTLTAGLALPLLLGARWHPAILLLMLLAPPAIAQTLGWLARALLVGRGRSGLQLHLALLNAGLTVAGVLGGLPFGIRGIAVGVGLSVVLGNLAYIVAAMAELHLAPRLLARATQAPLAGAGLMVAGVALLRLLLPPSCPLLAALLLCAGLGVALYGSAIWLLAPDLLGAVFARHRAVGMGEGSSA